MSLPAHPTPHPLPTPKQVRLNRGLLGVAQGQCDAAALDFDAVRRLVISPSPSPSPNPNPNANPNPDPNPNPNPDPTPSPSPSLDPTPVPEQVLQLDPTN